MTNEEELLTKMFQNSLIEVELRPSTHPTPSTFLSSPFYFFCLFYLLCAISVLQKIIHTHEESSFLSRGRMTLLIGVNNSMSFANISSMLATVGLLHTLPLKARIKLVFLKFNPLHPEK